MNTTKTGIVQIVYSDKQPCLSKGKKTFNKLINQINAHRKELSAWEKVIPLYQQKYSAEFLPLVEKLNGFKEKAVYLFDNIYKNNIFSRKEKQKIADFICSMSAGLLSDKRNEKLKQLYNKYSGSDFDLEKEEMQDDFKSMLEGMFDIDLGNNVDINSPEAILKEMAEKVQKKVAQEEIQRSKQKKSAKALAKEAAQKQADQEVSQSMKAVYRELVVSLHPDKERDHIEQQRKTALMQRINVAYKNKDLLTLLELQLEVEQIDQSTINTMTEERISHYNAVLTNQVSELKREILSIKHMLQFRFPTLSEIPLYPKRVLANLSADMLIINRDIKEIAQDLLSFKDIKNIKTFLREYRLQPQEDFGFLEMGDFFYSSEKEFMTKKSNR